MIPSKLRPVLPTVFVGWSTSAAAQDAGGLTSRIEAIVSTAGDNIALLGGAIALLLLGAILLRIFLRRRAEKSANTLAVHALVAMSQVAISDGRIEDEEVHQIAQILTRLTGQNYAPEEVMTMLGNLSPTAGDLEQVGQNLSGKHREIVLEAALNIAVAEGSIHPNEYAVVSELAERMRIGSGQFRAALTRISAHLHSAQPS